MKKKTKLTIIVILFVILMTCLIYYKIKKDASQTAVTSAKIESIFGNINSTKYVNVTKYIAYGTHFNLEGTIEIPKISGISISKANIIIKNMDNEEQILPSQYTYKDEILSFSTINELNEGLYLENLEKTNYYIFLKITFSNNEEVYYSLSNATEYENITYYTITKNNSNNMIKIDFDTYNNISFMGIKVTEASTLPDDVYDIVIDPGHGGKDIGAKSGEYTEADIVLKCALKLQKKLENLGYKVLITRDENQPIDENTAYNMYDDNGRVTIANESHAKLLISLHMNSNSASLSSGGVEVYAPSNCNLDFAQLLADNIVKTAKTTYSSLSSFKKSDGVYVRNFTNADILSFETSATKHGYEPYNLTTSTPYLYIIREIGGIATNAFVDGRNTSYGANKYVNSNIGIEGYLIELGYMIIEKDLNNVIKNEDLYMEAIAKSIDSLFQM